VLGLGGHTEGAGLSALMLFGYWTVPPAFAATTPSATGFVSDLDDGRPAATYETNRRFTKWLPT